MPFSVKQRWFECVVTRPSHGRSHWNTHPPTHTKTRKQRYIPTWDKAKRAKILDTVDIILGICIIEWVWADEGGRFDFIFNGALGLKNFLPSTGVCFIS